MSQVGSISATSPLAQRTSTPVFNTEPFYIPAELRASSAASRENVEMPHDAANLEALLAERLTDTIAFLKEQDTLSANDRHIALFNAIVQNRDQFPPEAFHIKTDLPGGASIETEIPAIGARTSFSQSVPVISTSRLFYP
jgi:hypothetical protein